MAKRARRQRRNRSIEHSVVAFLASGGVRASVARDGAVVVGEKRFRAPGAPEARNRWFNELVMEVAGDALIANARRHLGPDVVLRLRERVVVAERDGRAVAVIAGRSAMAVGRPVKTGNYLTPVGAHWDALVAALTPAPPAPTGNLGPVISAFRGLGVDAERVSETAIRLDGAVVEVPPAALTSKGARRKWINEATTTHLHGRLRARLERELPVSALGLDVESGPHGVVARRGDREIVAVRSDRARLADGTIRGRFVQGGPHWEELRRRLRPRPLSEVLRAAARVSLPCEQLGITLHDQRFHLEVRRRDEVVAIVTASRASLPTGHRYAGDFRSTGPQWQPLAHALRRRSARKSGAATAIVASPAPAEPALLLTTLPDDLPAALAAAAQQAGRRLREERSLVFEHAVLLETRDAKIRFAPLTVPPARLAVPFTFARGRTTVEGRLRLDVPPAAWFPPGTDREAAIDAWVFALIAYADLTCVEVAPLPAQPRARSQARPTVATGTRYVTTRRTEPASAFRPPPAFAPLGATARIMASYVAAHRRRLRPPSTASSERVRAAKRVGIALRKHETWVSGHFRGLPPEGELHFRWTAPAVLR
jgi:hypothetical protein